MIMMISNPSYVDSESHRTRERGAVAVEFAIVISLLLLITGGIIEFGRVFWYFDALTKATRDGARFMSSVPVNQIGDLDIAAAPGDCNSYSLTANRIVYCAAVAANVPGFTIGNVVVTCDGAACVNGTAPQYVNVAITGAGGYNVALGSWFPFAAGTLPLQPHTTMRYMR